MKTATQSQHNPADESVQTRPPFIPASKWNNYFDWPPQGGLRHIIFHAETNGFKPAITRVAGSVLINHEKFWEIVEQGTD